MINIVPTSFRLGGNRNGINKVLEFRPVLETRGGVLDLSILSIGTSIYECT